MNIIYEDDYGVEIYSRELLVAIAPQPGDTVVIDEEDYRVKSRTFYPLNETLVVTVTQNMVRSSTTESTDNSRHTQMQNAILALSKRQDASEKKNRALNEQIVTVRKHVNQQIRKDTKDGNT